MYMERLQAALPKIQSKIEHACEQAGRSDPGAIEMVTITKAHPIEALRAVREVGLETIGENRVQEAARKWDSVGDLGLSWHLIGHLQRNKVKKALAIFSLIQSVDSLRLAREISAEALKRDAVAPVLVQVNASGETTKYGFAVEEGLAAVKEIVEIDGLRVIGLMTMAPLTPDEAIIRRVFERTRELYDRCADQLAGFEPRFLSMGMSNDYEIAIEEGSNMVRLGTALFGERRQ